MNSITHSNVLRFCGIMDNLYSYDAVCNVLSVVSKAAFPVKGISTVIDGIPMAPDRPFQKQLDQQIILKS